MESQKFAVGESLSFGWNGMKKYFWFFFIVMVISLVFGIIAQVFDRSTDESISTAWTVWGLVIISVSVIIAAILKIGLIKSELAVADDNVPRYEFFKPRILLMFKLTLLYIITTIILGVGFILLIFPGIYFAIRLQYVYMATVDHGYWPFKALDASWRITHGHAWDLLLFKLATLGVNMLGFLALLIGMFASVPTTRIASAHVYRQLSRS